MYYSKIYSDNSGFTNQIFAFITNIILAYKYNHKVIIVDNFLNDISKKEYSPISEIFDINKINIFLKHYYNIIIIDKYNINFEFLYIKYGTKFKSLDLTDFIKENFYKNNILYISKNTIFNNIMGDPCENIKKNIFLGYKINNYIIEEIYSEKLIEDINIDFVNSTYNLNFGWIDKLDSNMFENILMNIHYNLNFIEKSKLILNEININNKINVIHLRLEDDAINHWSKQNNMTCENFKNYIENKYINLIKKYISKIDVNIILSSSLSNTVINFLKENNYNYKFNKKFFNDREKNSIVDLLISKYCNNIFIRNFNVEQKNGSTFSYYVGKLLKIILRKFI
jgi:hypothetical protein